MAAEEVEADKSDKVEQQVWRMAGLRGAARAAAAFVSECHRARNAKEVQLAFPTALNRVLMQIGTPLEQLRTSVTELHDDGRLVVPPGGFAASQRG